MTSFSTTLPRLEISSPGLDGSGRRVFQLVLHGYGPNVVWVGRSYDAAILAAEDWDRDGLKIIDTVGSGLAVGANFVPRVPAPWQIVEGIDVVDGIHVEIWRQRRNDTDRVILAMSPTSAPAGFTVALGGDEEMLPILKLIGPIVIAALRAGLATLDARQKVIRFEP